MHAVDIRHHPARCDRVLPFRRFHADLAAGRLPTVVFVMPDLHHEMHSGPVRVADRWLQRLVGELEANPVWRQDTRLVVTFDESNFKDVRSCCAGLAGGPDPDHRGRPARSTGRERLPTPTTRYCARRGRLRPGVLGHAATRPAPPSRRNRRPERG